jgi:hypothetical protein
MQRKIYALAGFRARQLATQNTDIEPSTSYEGIVRRPSISVDPISSVSSAGFRLSFMSLVDEMEQPLASCVESDYEERRCWLDCCSARLDA